MGRLQASRAAGRGQLLGELPRRLVDHLPFVDGGAQTRAGRLPAQELYERSERLLAA